MNAPFASLAPCVRTASLDDRHESARIRAFVDAHPDGTPFHLPPWSRAIAAGCGQAAQYLVAERAGALVGVLPLTEVHSPLFGRALVSSGFAVEGGILADSDAAARVLETEAWLLAQRLACSTLELRGGQVHGSGWQVDAEHYCYFARPIAADDDAELRAIPRRQRAEVRRSFTFDLGVTIGSGATDRAAHYAVYAQSVRNLGSPVFPRALFDAVLHEFGGDVDILTVWKDGVPLASTLSLYWRGAMYPYWGGGTRDARTWRANDRMYFAMIRHGFARGCTRFDLGRSKVGTGAAAFKKNFGFPARPLVYFKKSAAGTAPREINPLDPRFSLGVALWQRLPLAVANRVGPLIARGLG
ncbi:FemAB family XrtA/PEP-CTERM system-associated protein [Sphingomonas japonica]|uniref:FemAB-related protein (PEP-CTERM system-associated) n=1 Tax=Sphingomonas japonica TaxID=511662 RepID=A0ABX0U5S3_9SPHN|nr:FemAB family XrtA/PEP-CTERM system-associated protein [Sphingomonas japonica]NIJ25026.1 FemAB-related protein (PEP-CTERM system-associated) [Sphingomonas japonica]